MRKEREALLVAALAGLVIVGAAAFVVQPSIGANASQTSIRLGEAAIFQPSGPALARPA